MSRNSNKKHQTPKVPTIDIESAKDADLRQELIDELNDLATANPERRITRDFYRNNSDHKESDWSGIFGSFPEFLKQAGLQHTRYRSKIAGQTARHANADIYREFDGQRKQYGNLYPKDKSGRWKTMVAGSDFHDVECDPFFARVFTDTVKNIQPDIVCLAGDIFDLPEFGKYGVDPREWDVVGRVKAGRDIIRRVREAAPEAQLDFLEGNHEARLLKHLAECSPALRALLADLHDMSVAKLLKLDEYEVNYHAKGDLAAFTDAQLKRETQKNFKIYWDSLAVHHFPVGRELGLPGFHGHHHKHMVSTHYNASYGSYEWHQLGSGHMREAPYCNGEKWNNGFIIAEVDTLYRYVNFEYVTVGTTMAKSGGNFYYRQEDEFFPALTFELADRKR